MTGRDDPFRPPDDAARAIARGLVAEARIAALGVLWDGAPYVARVALGQTEDGAPVTLVSDLSHHTGALRGNPAASLLIAPEPGERGDPLNQPRLTLQARARFAERASLRERWLAQHPKARLYVDFADFNFVVFEVGEAHLNAGFGRAFRLGPADLGL